MDEVYYRVQWILLVFSVLFLNPVFSATLVREEPVSSEQTQTTEEEIAESVSQTAPPKETKSQQDPQQTCSPDLSTKPSKASCAKCWQTRGEPVWNNQSCSWRQGSCAGSKPEKPQCSGTRKYTGQFDESGCTWPSAEGDRCPSAGVCRANADCDSGKVCRSNSCVALADCIGGKIRNEQNKCICPENTLWDRLYKVCRKSCPETRPYYSARLKVCCPHQTRQVLTYQGCFECARDSQCGAGEKCVSRKCVALRPVSTTVTPLAEINMNARPSRPNSCSASEVLDFSFGYNKCCPADKPMLYRGTYTMDMGKTCVECNYDADCSNNQVCIDVKWNSSYTRIIKRQFCEDNPVNCPAGRKYMKDGQCVECTRDMDCSIPGRFDSNGNQVNGGAVCENNRCVKKGDCPLDRPYMDEVTGQCCNRFHTTEGKRRCHVCHDDKPYTIPGGCYGPDMENLHDCGEGGFRMSRCVQCLGDPHCESNQVCNNNHVCVNKTSEQEPLETNDVDAVESDEIRGSSGVR